VVFGNILWAADTPSEEKVCQPDPENAGGAQCHGPTRIVHAAATGEHSEDNPRQQYETTDLQGASLPVKLASHGSEAIVAPTNRAHADRLTVSFFGKRNLDAPPVQLHRLIL
jgi:hypothetical protein